MNKSSLKICTQEIYQILNVFFIKFQIKQMYENKTYPSISNPFWILIRTLSIFTTIIYKVWHCFCHLALTESFINFTNWEIKKND